MTPLSFDKADELREFLFTVIESLPGGVLLADRQGLLLAANQKARSLLGFAGSSVQNRSCWELLGRALGADREGLAALRRPGGRRLYEMAAAGTDFGSRYWLISRNELQSPFLHISGFFLSIEDVTFPAMVEAQLERNRRFSAMRETAVAMSQELKNPLGSLELYASILNRELAGDPDNQRLTVRMLDAVRSMDHLLDNFMAFARLPRPERKVLHIRQWLDEALDRLRPLGDERKISFVPRYGHVGEEIVGDPDLLGQLVLNLGVNAIESMPAGGEVRIVTKTRAATRRHPAFLEIKVIDRGEGIPREQLDKIFDPFFTTRRRDKGLGLPIAHHIAEAHQGFVSAESRLRQGSTFVVLLPYDERTCTD